MNPEEAIRQEFNRWAEAGRGEEMEAHHSSIAEQTMRFMDLKAGERVLDLGCGTGWATRILARLVADGPEGFGQVVGMDIAEEMIRRGRAASRDFENILYVWGSAHQIPWEENFFDKVLSVESFYYYADQDRALAELFRVMAPRGRMFLLINLYKDNPYSLRWIDHLNMPVQVRSEAEYVQLLKAHAFEDVVARRIPDESPTPQTYDGKWFRNADELRDFKRIGALLLTARKPEVRSQAPAWQIY
ncbi:MAG TPA: class I SAM-dependent methyltransferase [Terriglobales bacterium]|nr:class I SAM-dependent methyltransferase [Terriglobales bacterium]